MPMLSQRTGDWRPAWEVYKYGDNLYKAIYHVKPIPIMKRKFIIDVDDEQIDFIKYCIGHNIDVYYNEDTGQFDTISKFDGTKISKVELKEIIEANRKNVKEENIRQENERYRTNLIRARNTIEELALCNDFDFFVTITVNPKNGDRENLQQLYERFVAGMIRKKNERIRRDCKKHGKDYEKERIKYVIVPELHGDGVSWHLHGLVSMGEYRKNLYDYHYCNSDKKLPSYIRKKAVDKDVIFYDLDIERNIGYNIWERVKNREKVARYITKYVCKGFGQMSEKMEAEKNLFWASKGLKRRIPVESASLNEDDMEIEREYTGENCTVIWYHKK